MVAVAGETDLLEIVLALRSGDGRANLLHGGQQQSDEHRDDTQDDEQFNERKRFP
jgi:hypothetical protein